MAEPREYQLVTFLTGLKITTVYTPLVATKEQLSEWLTKHLVNFIPSIYTVSWRESENPMEITYSKLLEKVSINRNSLFILDDAYTFASYASEIVTYEGNNNYFCVVSDILTNKFIRRELYRAYPKLVELWPAPLDMDINIVYREDKSLITRAHLESYQKEFLEYRKRNSEVYVDPESPRELIGILNVFLDQTINNLESQNISTAFSRSPKFKSLVTTILLNNKKRHYINMIDGRYGIESFEALFNKIGKTTLEIITIRNQDPYKVKTKKLEDFNSTNKPMILLSDFNFTDGMTPKNIDFYHITSGGELKDMISIFSMVKGVNYTGSYPRKFNVVNYTTETLSGDKPIDAVIAETFEDALKNKISVQKVASEIPARIVFKGNDLFVMVNI